MAEGKIVPQFCDLREREIHSFENLSKEERRRREWKISPGILERKEEVDCIIDEPFTMEEMRKAIKSSRLSSPGKDKVCFVMLKNIGESASV